MQTDNTTLKNKAKEWWNNLNYQSRKKLADTYTDNSGNVDAALMMGDETIEQIYLKEHPEAHNKQALSRIS